MALPGVVRRVLVASLIFCFLLVGALQPAEAAAQDEQDEEDKPTVNLELILDSSGSMAEEIEPGVARIDAARQALNAVIDALPRATNVNVGMRVYGHEGTSTEAGRETSCRSTELRVPLAGVDTDLLRTEVTAYQPVGWTPLGVAIASSEGDFPDASPGAINAAIVLTDGFETCGGDPCFAARQLANGPKAVTTHVIGFALTPEDQQALQCITDGSGGMLLSASTADELTTAFFRVLEALQAVETTGTLEIESLGGVYPEATVTREDLPADIDPATVETSFAFTTSNVLEVPAGLYTVAWTNPSGSETSVSIEVIAGEATFIRGSLLRLPFDEGEVYELTALDGTVIWMDQVEFGDAVWLLPGTYRLTVEGPEASTTILSMTVQTQAGAITEVSAESDA